MSNDIFGLKDFEKSLERMQKQAESLSGTHSVDLKELLTDRFMREHTRFSSFDQFLKAGGFVVNSKSDFEAIPDDVFDEYVSKSTNFRSWKDMLDTATQAYVDRRLGLGK